MFKIVFILLCYFLVLTGVFDFNLWSQVIELYNSSIDLKDLVLHPHGVRFLLVLPIFMVSDSSGVHYDLILTVMAPFMLLSIVLLILKQISYFKIDISSSQKRILFLLLSIVVMLLASYMNGRILFALLGFSMISYTLVCWDSLGGIKKALLIILSLLLMSVSSGTFMIGVLSISLFVFYSIVKKGFKKNILLVFFILIGLAYSFPLLEILVMKNIDYYGSVSLMLNHGFGRVLTLFEPVVLWGLASIFILIVLIQMFFISLYKKYLILLYLLAISISVGVFGYSALSMSLVPLLVVGSLLFLTCLKYAAPSKLRLSSVRV